jgi:hypothetical protein
MPEMGTPGLLTGAPWADLPEAYPSFQTRHLSSQSLPQNPCLISSWYVNARSMTEPSEMEVTKAEGLDAIFRAHYDRVARVIGRVIHDQARAEELAVEVFLKWRLAIVMGVRSAVLLVGTIFDRTIPPCAPGF